MQDYRLIGHSREANRVANQRIAMDPIDGLVWVMRYHVEGAVQVCYSHNPVSTWLPVVQAGLEYLRTTDTPRGAFLCKMGDQCYRASVLFPAYGGDTGCFPNGWIPAMRAMYRLYQQCVALQLDPRGYSDDS